MVITADNTVGPDNPSRRALGTVGVEVGAVAVDLKSADDTPLGEVVPSGTMQRRTLVPDRQVTLTPLPAAMQRHVRYVLAQELENHVALSLTHTNHMVDEALGVQQRSLAGLWVSSHQRMLNRAVVPLDGLDDPFGAFASLLGHPFQIILVGVPDRQRSKKRLNLGAESFVGTSRRGPHRVAAELGGSVPYATGRPWAVSQSR